MFVLVVACAGPAVARDEDLFVGPSDLRTLLFGSFDGGRSVFASGGFKRSLAAPLDRTGPIVMETNGYGVNEERVRTEGAVLPALRVTTKAATLIGYQWNLPGLFVTALGGPEVVHEQLTVDGTLLRVSQVRPGLQGQVEIWAEPTSSVVLTANAVAGSARGTLWARASAGYKVWKDVVVGPEVTTYLTHTYNEVRWGGHVTSVPLWTARLRLSGGWMSADDGRRGSPYVSLSVWVGL